MITKQASTCLAGKKLKKSAQILEILGCLDELNCLLGAAKVFSRKKALRHRITKLQDDLVEVGGCLSGVKGIIFSNQKTKQIEEEITNLKDASLKKFSRPGINQASVFLHLARVAARRLERQIVSLANSKNQPERLNALIDYFNRFSSLLFWLAVKEEKQYNPF